jgi:hypothetical protein
MLTQRFLVRTEKGQELYVNAFVPMIDTSTLDGPSQITGIGRLVLSDGTPVNMVDEDTFVVVATGERLTRVK